MMKFNIVTTLPCLVEVSKQKFNDIRILYYYMSVPDQIGQCCYDVEFQCCNNVEF